MNETTQAIVFIKQHGQWKLQKFNTPLEDITDIENFIKQKRFEDFKIWLIEDIDSIRYWNDINFYNPANFIYLPLKTPDNKKWTWFNLNEDIPYPKYSGYLADNFKVLVEQMDKNYLQFSFPNFSENKYPISRNLFGLNQIDFIKEFLLKLKQNGQANCTVSGTSPFTFLAWGKEDTIRFQLWSYDAEPLFERENGMILLLDLEVNQVEFYNQFEKFVSI